MSNVTQLHDPEVKWVNIKNKLEEAEGFAYQTIVCYCDLGDMLREERASMSAENFLSRVKGSLNKKEVWASKVMKLSFHRMDAIEHESFRQAYEAVKGLPKTETEKMEKKAWPSEQGKGGGRPKGSTKPKAKVKTKKIGFAHLIGIAFPDVNSDKIVRRGRGGYRGELDIQWDALHDAPMPSMVEEGSQDARDIIEAFQKVYTLRDPERAEVKLDDEIAIVEKQLTDKQAMTKWKALVQKRADNRFETAVQIEAMKFAEQNTKRLFTKLAEVRKKVDMFMPVFANVDYKLIRGCLHADRLDSLVSDGAITDRVRDKFNKAFTLLEQNKERLCGIKPDALSAFDSAPRTAEEFLLRKKNK